MSGKATCPYCRFFSKVKDKYGCWRWQGTKDKNGYGYIHDYWDKERRKSYPISAHRFSWSFLVGLIPFGKKVYHLCNNSDCVKPKHLAIGGASDYAVDWRSEWRKKGKPVLTSKEYIFRAQGLLTLLLMATLAHGAVNVYFAPSVPATLQDDFIANATSQYVGVLTKSAFQTNTYTLTVSSKNPAYLPPSPVAVSTPLITLDSITSKLINISTDSYVYGYVDGMFRERVTDIEILGDFGVHCSSAGYFVRQSTQTTWNPSVCGDALNSANLSIYQQFGSTVPVVP